MYGLTQMAPVQKHIDSLGSSPYGVQASALYAVYGCVMSFAVHGWYCTFGEKERQLQAYEPRKNFGK